MKAITITAEQAKRVGGVILLSQKEYYRWARGIDWRPIKSPDTEDFPCILIPGEFDENSPQGNSRHCLVIQGMYTEHLS